MEKNKEKIDVKESKQEIKINLWNSEIIERQVVKFGTGGHVIVPKEYIGKTVKLIFLEDDK
jgi:putative transposon-encoded protein